MHKLSAGTVLGATALVVALAGTGAAADAVKLINGSLIKKNTVTSKQIKDGTITTRDLAPSLRARTPGVPGPAGPAGAPGPRGVAGSAVASGLVGGTTGSLSLYQGAVPETGIAVWHEGTGIYCIEVAGYPSTSHVLVATPNYADATTAGDDDVKVIAAGGSACDTAAGRFQIYGVDGSGALSNVGFTFVIN
jgi:hypothetical protein